MIIETYTGQLDLANGCDIAIYQPDRLSWRSKIYPMYNMIQYKKRLAYMSVNCKVKQFDYLEQIDIIWLHCVKYKEKCTLVTKNEEYKTYFDYFTYKGRVNPYTSRMINLVLSGCKKRNIPILSNPIHLNDDGLCKMDIDDVLPMISLQLKIPLSKLKLNYALKFPVLRDIETFVPEFYKTYISI